MTDIEVNSESYFPQFREYCPSAEGWSTARIIDMIKLGPVNSPTTFISSPLALAVNITSTHFGYPRRDGQAELARVAWLNAKTVSKRTVTPLSTNLAQLRVTLLMGPTTLPLS